MHFKFLIASLLLGASQSVLMSAAPLTPSLVARDYMNLEVRGRPYIPSAFHDTMPTVVSLLRHKHGKKDEHWGLHLHEPLKENHTGSVMGTTIDAYRKVGDRNMAPLTTGVRYYIGAHAGNLSHVADIPKGKHQEAIDAMGGVHCKAPPTEVNCVDWTKHAVTALHDKGLISHEKMDQFQAFHEKEHAAVRKKTDWRWEEGDQDSGSGTTRQSSRSGSPKH